MEQLCVSVTSELAHDELAVAVTVTVTVAVRIPVISVCDVEGIRAHPSSGEPARVVAITDIVTYTHSKIRADDDSHWQCDVGGAAR
jgi:hypothetical protein